MVQLQYSEMLERFKDVPDPRIRPNRIYPWQFLWGLISAALASACQTPTAIARWIREHRDELLAVLPPSLVRLPCKSTIRRTLARVDASKLEAALTTLTTQAPPASVQEVATLASTPLRGQAIDGKNLRGVTRDGHPCLWSAWWSTPAQPSWPRSRWHANAMSAVPYQRCWRDAICVARSSPWMRCIPSSQPRARSSRRTATI